MHIGSNFAEKVDKSFFDQKDFHKALLCQVIFRGVERSTVTALKGDQTTAVKLGQGATSRLQTLKLARWSAGSLGRRP